MAPHSSTLAWKIPWTEEPGRLQSMGLLRVGNDWATSLSLFHFHALEKEMATHSSVLAWRIPGAGEPGGLLSMGSHRVGHDWSDLAAAAAAADPVSCLILLFMAAIKVHGWQAQGICFMSHLWIWTLQVSQADAGWASLSVSIIGSYLCDPSFSPSILCCAVLSCSLVSDSFRPHGL